MLHRHAISDSDWDRIKTYFRGAPDKPGGSPLITGGSSMLYFGLPKPGQVVATVEAQGGEAVIPSRKNAVSPREIDWDRYKDRNLVERFWSKIKQYRRDSI